MEKGVGKRGRPRIKSWIMEFIASVVQEELDKPENVRLPIKLLAYELQKRIASKGERPPELSTLEKKISAIKSNFNSKPSPLDAPWTVGSMNTVKYSIPAEALPSVLRVWFFAREWGDPFTIREAKWAAHLYAAIKDTENLYAQSKLMARLERLYAIVDVLRDHMGSPRENLEIFSIMTGRVITKQEWHRLLGYPEEFWDLHSEEDKKALVDTMIKIELPEGTRIFNRGVHYEGFEETERNKEAQNEKQKRSKNEGRHKKAR